MRGFIVNVGDCEIAVDEQGHRECLAHGCLPEDCEGIVSAYEDVPGDCEYRNPLRFED